MIIPTQTTDDKRFHYAPDSAIWTINRERVIQVAGGRVLLMQLAHPMVAEAVYDHSYVFDKPLIRLHRTLSLTLTMVFGTHTEREQAIAEIDAAHRPAVGELKEAVGKHDAGATYNPFNPRQALWVFATLIEGALSAYDTLVAPLDSTMKEAFYQDSLSFARWMHIRERYLPDSYEGLLAYMDEAIASGEVAVGTSARKIAPFITAQSIPVVNWLSYPVYRFSVGLLPDAIREQYEFTFGSREQAMLERACKLSRNTIQYIPKAMRFVPEYHRAMRLLRD
jgi:uncharacterized protein (DUF2236 family)